MKKGLISAITIVVIVLIGVLIFSSDDENYVNNIENDVIALEEELMEVEAMIASNELTEEEATLAYKRVHERLVSIETSVEASEGVFLSDEQKQQLVAALQRFQDAIANYSSVLNVLEESADDVSVEGEANNRQRLRSGNTISTQLQIVAEALEEHIMEIISDEELEEILNDEADSEEEENEETATDETDEASTSTDSDATTTEETN